MGIFGKNKYDVNFISLPQQVSKNKIDIENLQKIIKQAYKTTTQLTEQSTSVALNTTNITDVTIKSGWLIDPNGLLFQIASVLEDLVYINFWANLKGIQGDIGPANTLTIGNVETLETGEQATAQITGNAPNQTLNLGLPKGNTGDRGAPGLRGEQGPQGEQGLQGKRGFGFYTTQQQILSTGTTQIKYGDIIGYDNPQVGDFIISENEQSNGYYGRITSIETLTTTIEYIGTLKGEKGINYTGEWVSGGEYFVDDVVTYNGSAYICINNINGSTTTPLADTTNWSIFVTGEIPSDSIFEFDLSLSPYTDFTKGSSGTIPKGYNDLYKSVIRSNINGNLYNKLNDINSDLSTAFKTAIANANGKILEIEATFDGAYAPIKVVGLAHNTDRYSNATQSACFINGYDAGTATMQGILQIGSCNICPRLVVLGYRKNTYGDVESSFVLNIFGNVDEANTTEVDKDFKFSNVYALASISLTKLKITIKN